MNTKQTISIAPGRAHSRIAAAAMQTLDRVLSGIALATAVLAGVPAHASTVVPVAATGDLYAAGYPDSQECCNEPPQGTGFPSRDPTLAPITLVSGEYLTFTTTGGAAHAPAQLESPTADGDTSYSGYGFTKSYGTGIVAATNVYFNGLAGVFLGPGSPTQPTTQANGTSFASISPLIGQIFFIGDGLTGTGSGAVQTFYVPDGATRLYLGIIDDGGDYDNHGNIVATITANLPGAVAPVSGVPEPETWTLMLLGSMGAIRIASRGRRGREARS